MVVYEEEWLPQGSVVLIDGFDVPVVITGRLQKNAEDDQVFDYTGTLFPTGLQQSNEAVMFNSDKVSELLFLGYRNEDELKWSKELTKAKEELKREDKDARA